MYLIEEIVHSRLRHKQPGHCLEEKKITATARRIGDRKINEPAFVASNNSICSFEQPSSKSGSSVTIYTKKHDETCAYDDWISSKNKSKSHKSNDSPCGGDGGAHAHAHSHSHSHSHLEIIIDDCVITPADGQDGGAGVDNNRSAAALRGLLIVLGLSVHELFEGLAIGLESSAGYVWYMFGAVAAHKFIIAFCIGVELVSASTSTSKSSAANWYANFLSYIYVCMFAIVSPLGIGIGMFLTAGDGTSSAATAGSTGLVAVLLQVTFLLFLSFFIYHFTLLSLFYYLHSRVWHLALYSTLFSSKFYTNTGLVSFSTSRSSSDSVSCSLFSS